MKNLTITLEGRAPLLIHNERLAVSTDEYARPLKAITSKSKKSDDDYAEMARLEYLGGLYLTSGGRSGLPAWNVFRSIQDGARLNRLGKQVERGLFAAKGDEIVEIKHSGPSDIENHYRSGGIDTRTVRVGQQRVVRTRPRYIDWSVAVDFIVDTEVLRLDDLALAVDNAGRMIGIGDYRPRFGRYEATIVEVN